MHVPYLGYKTKGVCAGCSALYMRRKAIWDWPDVKAADWISWVLNRFIIGCKYYNNINEYMANEASNYGLIGKQQQQNHNSTCSL